MSESDSFIEEVTEEVRRDRLYKLFRKYSWIPLVAVLLIVGIAAWNEWRKASEMAAAQALGDAVLAALQPEDPAARAVRIAAVETDDAVAKVYLDLLSAAARTEAKDKAEALALLDQVANAPDASVVYRDLAALKAVMLRGKDQERTNRMETLDRLARAGAPFRVFAMEQKAIAFFEYGDNDAAIGVLRLILDEPGATQGLIQRTQQLIVAMGGELSTTEDDEAGDNG